MPTDGRWWVQPRGSSIALKEILRDKRERDLGRLVALVHLSRESTREEFNEARAGDCFEILKGLPASAIGRALLEQPTFGCWFSMVESALSARLGERPYDGYFASIMPSDYPPLVSLLAELWRYAAGAAMVASRSLPKFRLYFSGDVSFPGAHRWLPASTAGHSIDMNQANASAKEAVLVGDEGCQLELDRADVFLRFWAQEEAFPGDQRGVLAEAEALDGFAARLSGAVALLRLTRPSLVEEISLVMRSVVPLLSIDPEVNLSVSAPEFLGTAMITYDSTPMLAEALAHEYRHNLLNALTEGSPLVTQEAATRSVYSPWRDDPRPVMGLLHALFTFTEVAEFLRAAVHSGKLSPTNTRAAARRCLAHMVRLEIGIDEMDAVTGLTTFGSQMMTGFKDAFLGLRADVPSFTSLGGTDSTEAVREHERIHRNRTANASRRATTNGVF